MSAKAEDFLPLRPVELQVLASLRSGNRHGYGILQEIEARGEGGGAPGLVTLYRALKRMEKAGLVERAAAAALDDPDDDRRRRYRITALGKRVLRAEALRLSPLVREALRATEPADGGTRP